MRWVRRGITVLAGLALVALAILYGGSGYILGRSIDADLPKIRALTDPASIAEGARMARIVGCTRCHGTRGQGRLLSDVAQIGEIVAPSLPRTAARATDEQIARTIRNGIGIDARAMFLMPNHALNHLSDDDVARLTGWIRSLPTSAFDIMGTTTVGPLGRLAILTKAFPDSVDLRHGQPLRRPADTGRYFVQIVCEQCHALDHAETIDGSDRIAPALKRAMGNYDFAAFAALVRSGSGRNGHQIPAMAEVGKSGLNALSDSEIEAIRGYLASMPNPRLSH